MSANTSLAIRIATILDNKGLKQADKGVKGLQSSVKKLAGAAGIGLGTAAIVKFGKSAAKAFIEDQKEVTRLTQVVKNLGIAFEAPAINDYIDSLSRLSGVADSSLRPAMQTLLQITGSVTESQKILAQSLDVSAATGIDVATVAEDIGRAFTGNTKGLRKYNLGLTQAELTTGSYADIQAKLNKLFAGSNAAQLETYAGQMSLLSVAAGEASETIGGGLIDAMITLTESKDVTDFVNKIDSVAQSISNVIGSVGRFSTVVKGLFTGASPEEIRAIFDPAKNASPLTSSNVLSVATLQKQDAARKKAEADAAKRAREIALMQKKTLDTQKKSLALTKASKTIDLERISISAALKGQISETDRLSLNLQLALLDQNETAASKLSGQLTEAVKRQNELNALLLATPEAPNPYRNWIPPTFNYDGNPLANPVSGNTAFDYGQRPNMGGGYDFFDPTKVNMTSGGQPPQVNVTVTLDSGVVGDAVRDVSVNDSLSGSFNTVNRTGRFGTYAI